MIVKKKYKQLVFGILTLSIVCLCGYIVYEYIQLINAKVIIGNSIQDNELYFGENYLINVKAENSKYKDKIIYKSKNENVGKVNDYGKVVTYNPGKLQIEIYIKGSHQKETIELNVKEHEYEIKKPQGDTLRATKTAQFIAYDKTMKKNATHIEWISSKKEIAQIDDTGKIKFLKPGKTKISIKSNGKIVDSVDVNVKNKESKKIYSNRDISLMVKERKNLNSISLPSTIKDTELKYTIKNNEIAILENKEVIPKKAGNTELEIFSEKTDIKYIIKINVTNPYIEKGKYLSNTLLKQKGADSKNKLMIVAHPDDETLWGGGHLSQGGWFVVCLTNGNNSVRSNEYHNVLNYFGANGVILSYPDLTNGKKDNWSSVKSDMMKDLQVLLGYKNWSTIVTHNSDGEYGHIHHKMTHRYIKSITKKFKISSKLRFFGKYYDVGKVPESLVSNLSENAIARKKEALSLYTSKQWSLNNLWYQMVPYEYWS